MNRGRLRLLLWLLFFPPALALVAALCRNLTPYYTLTYPVLADVLVFICALALLLYCTAARRGARR